MGPYLKNIHVDCYSMYVKDNLAPKNRLSKSYTFLACHEKINDVSLIEL